MMNITTKAKLIETIKSLEKDYDFQAKVLEIVKIEQDEYTKEEVIALLEKANEEDAMTDCKILYRDTAIDYLKENDPSMMDAFEIASGQGFGMEEMDSEILASIHKSHYLEEEYETFTIAVIEELFYN